MAKIDFSTSQELCSLIEYCRMYDFNATDFTGDFAVGKGKMRPDLQSTEHNIGIECTNASLPGVLRAWNAKDNPVFACATSISSDPVRLIDDIVANKTEKLNRVTAEQEEHYTKFDTNVLFVKVPEELYFFNCCDVCNPVACTKADNCDNCTNPKKISYVGNESIVLQAIGFNCSREDCKEHKICTVGAFVKALQNFSFDGKYKYNPIIFSKERYNLGEDRSEFCCWVVDTDNYTIVERRGKRVFLESERHVIEGVTA